MLSFCKQILGKRSDEIISENVRFVKNHFKNVVRHDTLDNLINDLINSLFTRDELKTSSYTGTVANMHKNVAAKSQLNKDKIAKIEGIYFKFSIL